MKTKVNIDKYGNVKAPTFVLAKASGNKINGLTVVDINKTVSLTESDQISFKVYKELNKEIWDDIVDFRLVWEKELDQWYKISVVIDDLDEEVYKVVSCVQLPYDELSRLKLYNIEINTEDDIARTDYDPEHPTIFYSNELKSSSLLDRLLEKAPHYTIKHVDSTLKKIQKTFSFNDKSIYDAFQEISDEVGCLFIFDANSNADGSINRTISAYDLMATCEDCGYRGDYTDECPECHSHNINYGYGEDTTIFITSDELGNQIEFTTDTNAVHNCFKLEAGDDLMTATVRTCNPNGTDYIWYIPDYMRKDMSDELQQSLESYDKSYQHYSTDYSIAFNDSVLNSYNDLVNKYKSYNDKLMPVDSTIVGFSSLMTEYYNTIDFESYLRSVSMPSVEIQETTVQDEINKLSDLVTVSVQDASIISVSTANNAVVNMAKVLVSSVYKVEVESSSLDDLVWIGQLRLTNYSDDEDTLVSEELKIKIDDNYESFVRQKIDKLLNKNDDTDLSITGLFKMELDEFKKELTKYCLTRLESFLDACQSCVDILTTQEVSDKNTWSNNTQKNLYDDLYLPYLRKLRAIEYEIHVRSNEIDVVLNFQNQIIDTRNAIQDELNIKSYLGDKLWLELCSYRMEDKYSNSNYVSDGLDNAEQFKRANEFLKVARNEIYKSAEKQHSISTSLRNLLSLDKFEKLIDHFEVGNWIRIRVDKIVYKLRLISYELSYDDNGEVIPDEITVDFSDVLKTANGLSDQQSIIKSAVSMASSYDYVQRQASQSVKTKQQLNRWKDSGFSVEDIKIITDAENQSITYDKHGLLCREYLPITDDYDDRQLKIINRGLYLTDDNWETSRAGIGDFTFYNPKTQQIEESYGIVADTIIGSLVLSENVGIYNKNNSMTLDEDGLVITAPDNSTDEQQFAFVIQKKTKDKDGNDVYEKQLYIDQDGNLVMTGSLTIKSDSSSTNNKTLDQIVNNTTNGVISVDVEYYVSDSNSELIGGEWSTNAPDSIDDKYVWSRTKSVLVDGTENYSEPICIVGGSGSQGKDGESALTVQIESSNGNIFMSNNIRTVLTCRVYYGTKEVTNQVKQFTWQKIDQDGNIDESWNRTVSGNVIELTNADVLNRASFTCSIDIDI